MAHIKLTKLDLVVLLITVICIIGISISGYISDPSNRSPQVAYLYPAFGGTQDVWISDIDAPDNQQQLTFSEYGIFDFDVSTDGRWLVFAEKNSEFLSQLRLLDIVNNRVIDLVDCIGLNANCTTPVFSPDGTKLAYQRSELLNGQYGVSRIWLVDMTNSNYETNPLISDTQIIGHSPVWSADNNKLAFYSANVLDPGILIYNFVPSENNDSQLQFIPSTQGSMGTISPNGQKIIVPEIVKRDNQLYTYLKLVDLRDNETSSFTDPDEPTDDVVAQWNPDGKMVAFVRRYTDEERWTQGYQVYLRNIDSDQLITVAYDKRYTTSNVQWNSTGTRLIMQRFPLLNEDGTSRGDASPEIWSYDIETDTLYKVLSNAFLPHWASP